MASQTALKQEKWLKQPLFLAEREGTCRLLYPPINEYFKILKF